jgi:DNA-binding LytR/AlgR family response regulator
MTMIINIPERVLLIKVSRLADAAQATVGYTLVFYDITEIVSADDAAAPRAADARRRLRKIPTVAGGQIALVDVEEVRAIHSDGHYTRVHTAAGSRFCNLSIGDIEARLDPERFMRVHRSHIVNLEEVDQLLREDGRLQIRLRGEAEAVPVSRSSAGELLDRLGVPASATALRQG